MKLNIDLLSRICEAPGAPGYEDRIRALLIEELDGLTDELTVDNMGNLTAFKKGKSEERLMIAAHMDEISFMVNYIDDRGFVFFTTLGGFDPKTLTAQRVIIHGKKDIIGVMGSKPIHIMKPAERNKAPQISDFFIDTGLPAKEVKKIVSIGNVVTRERSLIEMGPCINCKSLDNRISVYILLEALRRSKRKKPPVDLFAVFTVQEEVGLRGAHVAAHTIDPDYGINLDTTIAFDVPGASPKEQVTRLGDGTAIKVMDSRTICDPRMVEFMKRTAQKNKIKVQMEVLTAGGTDTEALQRWGKHGSIAGAISIPTRNIHQVIEMVNKEDVENSIKLLMACIDNVASFKW